MKVKKILAVATLLGGIVVACNATTMCTSDDTVAIILDPQIAVIENGGGYNAAAMTWYVDFDYGRVSGIASCTPDSGSYGAAYPDRDYDQTVTGQYCYCKMTHPVASAWVYLYGTSSASVCSALCASDCRARVRDNSGFRGGVFGSVGQ